MNREDIEKAAKHTIDEYSLNPEYGSYFEHGFIDGAEWHINSVWHNVDIEPTEKKILVVIDNTGEISQSNFSPAFESWKEYVKVAEIVKWCYKKDLIPNTED